MCFCFFKQKTAYECRISDWSSDVCSSDLLTTISANCCGSSSRPTVSTLSWKAPDVGTGCWFNAPEAICRLFARSASTTAPAARFRAVISSRSEERRVGKECVRTCRYRGSPEHSNKNDKDEGKKTRK